MAKVIGAAKNDDHIRRGIHLIYPLAKISVRDWIGRGGFLPGNPGAADAVVPGSGQLAFPRQDLYECVFRARCSAAFCNAVPKEIDRQASDVHVIVLSVLSIPIDTVIILCGYICVNPIDMCENKLYNDSGKALNA